ncbi:Nucleoporin [Blumeria hordei DH14]|uniref:Nucleoporin n=1 Tax=Blumeria graminis f. sp. hordei (strain DH14) TaxID=546991 RepID=N1JHA8_BLUG1|nr:Nucleoporin [Blumeria hordei DH14]
MSETPRLRSSYPPSPGSNAKTRNELADSGKVKPSLPELPDASKLISTSSPVIPVHLIDAPSQRMYTSVVYIALLAYRLSDWWSIIEEDTTSIALFVKWCFIDLIFLFGIPFLRIPWLEWSDTTSVLACLAHIFINGILMFRIQLPIEGWLVILVKSVFDREISISESSIRPSNILHNTSLIMGKQIINILPEGSAVMNPDQSPFCIDANHPTASIPIYFNQTIPKNIELLRIDFETNLNETIKLSQREVKNSIKQYDENVLSIHYIAKKPGLYRLYKITDKSKLEVQRRMSDTLVVRCPRAIIKSTSSDKCLGDLSDINIEIEGTPPLRVMYSRTANGDKSIHHFQSIQPENFDSPLINVQDNNLGFQARTNISWGKSHHITVPLNETMMTAGMWIYSIDQIHDAVGNIANFSNVLGDDVELVYSKGIQLQQEFTVRERPVAYLQQCDSRKPLMVATGKSKEMPIEYETAPLKNFEKQITDTSHVITWKFSPLHTLTKTGDHGDDLIIQEYFAKSSHQHPTIHETGLYTLVGVRSKYCEGTVKEPSSCLLLNPPEPELSIQAEGISDNCAGNSIGLLVDLDLIGSPPFIVSYEVTSHTGTTTNHVEVNGLRHQLELKPTNAGHFKYQFVSIDDQVYKKRSLRNKGLVLEQDVKPPASAELIIPKSTIDACVEEPIEMKVRLSGESPFVLEYEMIHDGKRKKSRVLDIESSVYTIKTEPLLKGGEYTLAITSVQDLTGCKIFVNSEARFTVRRQRPKAAFGRVDGGFKIISVEGKDVEIPLRLTGQAPWTLKYRLSGGSTNKTMEKIATSTNDVIRINQGGKIEIIGVSDDQCPGNVDSAASTFEVDWFPRPRLALSDSNSVVLDGNKYTKREVCEGDVDTIKANLIGSPPFNVKYQVRQASLPGSDIIINKEFEAALGSVIISLDTSKAGTYEYRFLELSDALYDHDERRFSPIILEQKVNRKPAAHFTQPGQSYKYCEEELDGDEIIPIKLEGIPPFSIEVDIKHQRSSRPETVKVANIETNDYEFKIPHRVLSIGIHHVNIRKVRDSRGCQQKTDHGAPHVQVQVYDTPTIHPLDSREDFCVGERISYTLSGVAPFEVFYEFEGIQRRAKATGTTFKRFAEKPGIFTITGVTDKASECKAHTRVRKIIHAMPSVKISKGRQIEVDIHEGAEADIQFEFWGTPPFEFTYTRSTNARKGHKSQVLETRHEVSDEYSKIIRSSQEGTYEVVAIRDKYCSFSIQKDEHKYI